MALKIQIQESLKQSMRDRKETATGALRMLLASIAQKKLEKRYSISKKESNLKEPELEERSNLTDEEIQEVVYSEIKKRRESEEAFEKGGRPELAQKEKEEREVLQQFLPQQLSE